MSSRPSFNRRVPPGSVRHRGSHPEKHTRGSQTRRARRNVCHHDHVRTDARFISYRNRPKDGLLNALIIERS